MYALAREGPGGCSRAPVPAAASCARPRRLQAAPPAVSAAAPGLHREEACPHAHAHAHAHAYARAGAHAHARDHAYALAMPLYMQMHVPVHVHMRMHVYMHMPMHMDYTWMHMHTHVAHGRAHVHPPAHAHLHTRARVHAPRPYACTRRCTLIRTSTRRHTCLVPTTPLLHCFTAPPHRASAAS